MCHVLTADWLKTFGSYYVLTADWLKTLGSYCNCVCREREFLREVGLM